MASEWVASERIAAAPPPGIGFACAWQWDCDPHKNKQNAAMKTNAISTHLLGLPNIKSPFKI
jgi:hypothetical protein